MAILAGQHVSLVLGGVANPLTTSDHLGFTWVNQFAPSPFLSLCPRAGQQELTPAWPVEANGTAITGQRLQAHLDDWYYRIHITPRELDLGNVVSTQVTPVMLWNAYLEPRTVTSIDGLEEGIELAGQPAPPMLFPALAELTWLVKVTPDGQPVLDTLVSWVLDNGASPGIRMTARRVIAWAFVPDWGDGVVERLTWATDILQSETAVEQRRSVRLAPRRELEASAYVEGRERQLLDMALYGWSSRVWSLPIWHEVQLLQSPVAAGALSITCSTTYLDLQAGGLAMLRGESAFNSETVEVLAVTSTGLTLKRATQQAWPRGSRLYPARSARLMQPPSINRLTDTCSSVDMQFLIVEPCAWPEVLPSTLYRGRPVLELVPDESEDLTSSFEHLTLTLDSGAALPQVTDTANRSIPVQGHRWLELGRAARAAYRSLLYGLRGRQVPIWVPTHAADLNLIAVIAGSATTIDVANVNYTRFAQGRPGRRDIRIQLWDGTAYHRRVTGSTELDSSTERLAIDAPLGTTVSPADVLRISWMVCCRLDSDSVEIEHITDSEGLAASSLVFRGVRDDEF